MISVLPWKVVQYFLDNESVWKVWVNLYWRRKVVIHCVITESTALQTRFVELVCGKVIGDISIPLIQVVHRCFQGLLAKLRSQFYWAAISWSSWLLPWLRALPFSICLVPHKLPIEVVRETAQDVSDRAVNNPMKPIKMQKDHILQIASIRGYRNKHAS